MLVEGNALPSAYIPYKFTFNKGSLAYPLQIIDESDIPLNSLSTNMFKNNSITVEKTDFFVKSQNIFNRNTATIGYYIQNTNGNLMAASGWNASDYIPIKASTIYSRTFDTHVAFYDVNKNYISGYNNNSGHLSFTTPTNAVYLRLSVYSTTILTSTYMLVEGDVLPSDFMPFQYALVTTNPEHPLLIEDNRVDTIKKWKNKKWYSIGDSITAPGTYQNLVKTIEGMTDFYNGGVSGKSTRYWRDGNYLNTTYISNSDLVTIFLGTTIMEEMK